MIQHITCPRRMSEFGPWQRREGLDSFISAHTRVAKALNCSFCGSLDPETCLTWMANGGRITPTDKPYKMLISIDKEREQKFYFYHFNKEQQVQFTAIYNLENKPFLMGYPGHFYVLPYFCGRHLTKPDEGR